MFGYLVLLFTIIPAVELIVLIEVGARIGAINTLLLIVLTGIAGAALARLQGFRILYNIQRNLDKGLMPTEEMLDGVMVLAGGIVLLTPGFITDTIGFILLIPLTRNLIKIWLRQQIKRMMTRGQIVTVTPFGQRRHTSHRDDDDIIDIDPE